MYVCARIRGCVCVGVLMHCLSATAILRRVARASGYDCDCTDYSWCDVLAMGVGKLLLQLLCCIVILICHFQHFLSWLCMLVCMV